MTTSIDISPDDLEIVQQILAEHVPELEVRAFGSRATWTAREYSDLDLVLMAAEPLDIRRLGDMQEAFVQSDLPFQVDIVDWASASESFRRIIEEKCIVIQKAENRKDGWRKFTIGEIADIVGGGTPLTKKPENFDGNIPWLTPKDLSGHHDRYIDSGKRNLSQAGLENSSAKLVPARSVLLSTRAPIGYVALAKNPIATNQGFRNLLTKKGFSPEFLYYWLIQNTEELKRYASGSTFSELSGSALKNIELRLPSLPMQQKIANIIGTLDDKIELNRKMSETLEEMAQALFKSWFVDFDPVRAKMEGRWRRGKSLPGLPADLWELFPEQIVNSKLGEVPEGWKTSTIGKEVDVVGGATPSTKVPSFWNGTINWATPKDLSSLKSPVLINTSRKITKRGLAKISSGLLPEGTVLLSSRAPIGYMAITDIPLAINQGFIAMKCKKNLSPYYVWLWTVANMGTILNNANGSTFQEISKNNFRPLPIVVPNEPIRQAYDQAIKTLYRRMVINEHLSQTLTGIRDILLPKLISGELRVT